ncbi:transcriptional regulator [Actinomadura rayongensis]|uniref:Transcriptional regulator n=1 Tax=Actinomadura rayongensis TaxID=1429076 RepID=A0A6I4W4L5_9ACTN|nr:transcriptional regulator [Actinomadura rayongensis]MXQ63136.1 transcriptional regulator [Actinomadura rayongensis]
MTMNPNHDLVAVIEEAGISNKALAKAVRDLGRLRGQDIRCTHVDVNRWRNGMIPRGAKPELIALALGRCLGRSLTLADIGMASPGGPPLTLGLDFAAEAPTVLRTTRRLWSEDLNRAEFLRHGTVTAAMLTTPMARWLIAPPADPPHRTGRTITVGRGDVEAVRTTVHMFENLDHQFGGGHARTAAAQYLHSQVTPLLHGNYTEAVGRDLFRVAAQFTYKTGAMAYDTGNHGLARRYFVQALNLAHTSGDRALGGKVLALMSHQANFLGEFTEAVDLARAAKLGGAGHATPTVQAMYCAMEARALASLGDARGCLRALSEAEAAFAKRYPGDEPDWIGYFDAAEFHDEFGHCFQALGHTSQAVRHATLSLAASGDSYPRSRTFCRFTLATSHVSASRSRDRDVDQAVAVATEALPLVDQLKSVRVRSYIRTFNRHLDTYADTAAVSAFRERLAEVLVAS